MKVQIVCCLLFVVALTPSFVSAQAGKAVSVQADQAKLQEKLNQTASKGVESVSYTHLTLPTIYSV